MLLDVLAVGCGGFIGASARFLVTTLTNKLAYLTLGQASFGFPIGILAINFAGCVLMGWLALYLPQVAANPRLVAFVTTGCLGGFTTLSTFGLDTWKLVVGGEYLLAGLNVVLTLAVCFAGILLGVAVARSMTSA